MSYLEIAEKTKPYVAKGLNMSGIFAKKPLPIVNAALSILDRGDFYGISIASELQDLFDESLNQFTETEEGLTVAPGKKGGTFETVRRLLVLSRNFPDCNFCNARVHFTLSYLNQMMDTVEYYRYLGIPTEVIQEEVLGFFNPAPKKEEVKNEQQPNLQTSEPISPPNDSSVSAVSSEDSALTEIPTPESGEESSSECDVEIEGEIDIKEVLEAQAEALEENNPLPFDISDKTIYMTSRLPASLLKTNRLKETDEHGNLIVNRVNFYPQKWWLPEGWDSLNAEEIILGFNCPATDAFGIARSLMTQPFMKEFVEQKSFKETSRSTIGVHQIPHFKREDVQELLPTIQSWLLGHIDGDKNPLTPVLGVPRFTIEDQNLNFWSWMRQIYHGKKIADSGVNNTLYSVTTGEQNPIRFAGVYNKAFNAVFAPAIEALGADLEATYKGVPYVDDSEGYVYYREKAYSLNSAFAFGGWMEAVYREILNVFAKELEENVLSAVAEEGTVTAYRDALSTQARKEIAAALKLYSFSTPDAIDKALTKIDGYIANRCMKLVHGHRQTPFKALHSKRNNLPNFPLSNFHILEYFFLLTHLAPNSKDKYKGK